MRFRCPLSRYASHSSPPSTVTSAPVTKSEAALQRKAATPAKSSGVPTRPAAVRAMTRAIAGFAIEVRFGPTADIMAACRSVQFTSVEAATVYLV